MLTRARAAQYFVVSNDLINIIPELTFYPGVSALNSNPLDFFLKTHSTLPFLSLWDPQSMPLYHSLFSLMCICLKLSYLAKYITQLSRFGWATGVLFFYPFEYHILLLHKPFRYLSRNNSTRYRNFHPKLHPKN